MLTRIIVCLDVRAGRVVKGTRFEQLRDIGDPAELANRYEAEGADEIVFLDISASLEERATLLDSVRRSAEQLFIPLTVGGGMRTVDDTARAARRRGQGEHQYGRGCAAHTPGRMRGAIRVAMRRRQHRCPVHI